MHFRATIAVVPAGSAAYTGNADLLEDADLPLHDSLLLLRRTRTHLPDRTRSGFVAHLARVYTLDNSVVIALR